MGIKLLYKCIVERSIFLLPFHYKRQFAWESAEPIKFSWLMGSVGGWVFVLDVTGEEA